MSGHVRTSQGLTQTHLNKQINVIRITTVESYRHASFIRVKLRRTVPIPGPKCHVHDVTSLTIRPYSACIGLLKACQPVLFKKISNLMQNSKNLTLLFIFYIY